MQILYTCYFIVNWEGKKFKTNQIMKRKHGQPVGNGKRIKKEVVKGNNATVKIPQVPVGRNQINVKGGKKGVDANIEREKKQNIAMHKELAKIEEKVETLDENIEKAKLELGEVKKTLEGAEEQKSSDNYEYSEKLTKILQTCSLQQERVSMMEEDRDSLIYELKTLQEKIAASAYYVASAKNTAQSSKVKLDQLRKELHEKRQEAIALAKLERETRAQLAALMEKERKAREEDELIEFTIHQMKGRPYTILLVNGVKESEEEPSNKISINALEAKIPQKTDSWIQMKFDTVIWDRLDLCDNFELVQYWFDSTKVMLKKAVEFTDEEGKRQEEEEVVSKPGDEDNELTFFVLPVHNRIELVGKYLQMILRNLPMLLEVREDERLLTKVSGSVYSLNDTSEVMPLKLGEISPTDKGINEYIEIVSKEQKKEKKGNNYALELHVYASNEETMKKSATTLKIVFINTEDPKNLEEIQRRAREILQTKLNSKRYSVKGTDMLLQECLLSVKMGYLIFLWDEETKAADNEHLYNVIQAAKNLAECIPTCRFDPNSINSQYLPHQYVGTMQRISLVFTLAYNFLIEQ
eukprot:TRINITY_DN1217_c0_g1_i1.p2 TRINITY_DN1217_c0_g1~~TRINITY_DN1217_c0_g1_i1.p2  ORF type:complete len:581 (+),score=99.53 TRINITY_DN1217_c0_g1_i1:49-1791(+)